MNKLLLTKQDFWSPLYGIGLELGDLMYTNQDVFTAQLVYQVLNKEILTVSNYTLRFPERFLPSNALQTLWTGIHTRMKEGSTFNVRTSDVQAVGWIPNPGQPGPGWDQVEVETLDPETSKVKLYSLPPMYGKTISQLMSEIQF